MVKNLQKDYSNLYILERGGKFGLASAYIDGFKYGADLGYKAFVQMAADFSHNPEYLPVILNKLEENNAVVASRYIAGASTKGTNLFRDLIVRFAIL
ncbi:MAG: glycosyltransferase, partial [Phascolarctobacterium sp.]|nr:glycosyltransferase [Phascolarctobacterium sp.]